MADEGLPIPNPENFTSSPSLQTHIGLYVVTGKEHYLTPDNKYDPSTDAQIKADVKSTVDNKGAITDEDVIKNLDTAHRNERKANWETISVEDKMIELFGTDGKSEGWKKNAAGNKLRQGKTELTDAEKTFVAQFEIWSQNFQAHFDLADNKQQVFLNKFLGSTSLVIDKNADFQKVALETYEQFIRKLDTKQAQKSTAFIDRVKTVYGSVDIPKEDMTMIATLAEQLFGGETMGKVIAEIVDLQAKLRSGNPAAVQAQLSKEIGETPPQETIDTIIRFRNLAEIKEEKYDSKNPPTPQPIPPPAPAPAPSPTPTAVDKTKVKSVQLVEVLQTATPKDNEQLMKKAGEVIELAPPTTTPIEIKSNEDYFGSTVGNLDVIDYGYAYIQGSTGEVAIGGRGSAHQENVSGKVIVTDSARVFCHQGTNSGEVHLVGTTGLLFTPETFTKSIKGVYASEEGSNLTDQYFTVPDLNTTTTVKRPISINNEHHFIVVECANTAGDKALAVFKQKQITEQGKPAQHQLVFIDGDLSDNYLALEKRLLTKTGQIIDVVDPASKDQEFIAGVKQRQPKILKDIKKGNTMKFSIREGVTDVLGCNLGKLQEYANAHSNQTSQAILEYLFIEQARAQTGVQVDQQIMAEFGKVPVFNNYENESTVKLFDDLKTHDVNEFTTSGRFDHVKLTALCQQLQASYTDKLTEDQIKMVVAIVDKTNQFEPQEQQEIERYYKLMGIPRPTNFRQPAPIPAPEAPKPEPIPEAKVAKLVERMKANNAKINDAGITAEISRLNQEDGLTQQIVEAVIDRFDDIKGAERVTTAPGAENLLKRQNSAIEIVEQILGIKTADSKLLGYRLNELLQQLKVPFENDKYKIDPQKINEIKVMVQLLKLL